MRLNGIEFDETGIAALRHAASVVRLSVFGSILTDGFRAGSDIDLLVETDPLHPLGLLVLGGLQMDLSELLGRTVHLTLMGGVPPGERGEVLARSRQSISPDQSPRAIVAVSKHKLWRSSPPI
jgi:predicted nucleotidyltransferase